MMGADVVKKHISFLRVIVAFALFLCSFRSFAGGPWPSGKGHGFGQLGYSRTSYSEIFDIKGKPRNANGRFNDMTFQLFMESGISDKWTLKLIVPYGYMNGRADSSFFPSQSLTGFGNIVIGASYLIIDNKIKTAVRIEAYSPGKKKDDKITPYGLKTGYIQWQFSPILSVGTSGKKLYSFADIGLGIGTSKENIFTGYVEAGYSLTHTLKIAGVINARILLAGKAGNQLPTTNDLPVSYLYDPLQEYIGIGTKMIFSRKEKYGIVVSPFGAIMAKRVAYAWALNFGFFYKW